MDWVKIFLASLQILAKVSPDVVAQFQGGGQDTATKVGAALAIVNGVTSNLAAGVEPMEGIPPVHELHPAIVEHAESIPDVTPDPHTN